MSTETTSIHKRKCPVCRDLIAARVKRSAVPAARSVSASANEFATAVASSPIEVDTVPPLVSLKQGEYRVDTPGRTDAADLPGRAGGTDDASADLDDHNLDDIQNSAFAGLKTVVVFWLVMCLLMAVIALAINGLARGG